jgi:hypothetical protein
VVLVNPNSRAQTTTEVCVAPRYFYRADGFREKWRSAFFIAGRVLFHLGGEFGKLMVDLDVGSGERLDLACGLSDCGQVRRGKVPEFTNQ